MSSRILSRLVVQLAVEMAKYKSDWDQAAKDTETGAARVERATRGVDAASGALRDTLQRQTGAFGQAAGGAAQYAGAVQAGVGAAGALTVGVGAVVAALGAAGVAAYQGHQEQQKLNDSLLLTGNYAGLVAGQIDTMSLRMASSIRGTVAASREVLMGLAATGQFTVQSMGEVGTAVQLVARYSGRTNEEVLKHFASMGDGVAKWAAKANESYHFLDLATYRHIQQLEDQGRTQDAMRVASERLSEHIGNDLTRNLGTLERGWHSLKTAASDAWDSMKGLGRAETVEDRLGAASQAVDLARMRLQQTRAGGAAMLGGGTAFEMSNSPSATLRDALARQGVAQSDALQDRRLATNMSQLASAKKEAIAADQEWGRLTDSLATKQERLARELEKVRGLAEKRGSSASELADMEARVRERYTEKGRKKTDPYDDLERSAERRLATLGAELEGTEKLTEAEKLRTKYLSDLANGYIKFNEVRDRSYRLTLQEMEAKERESRATEQRRKEDLEAGKALEARYEASAKVIDKLQVETERENLHTQSIGLTKIQIAELTAKKYEDIAASKEREAVEWQLIDLSGKMTEQLQREAQAYRTRADASRNRSVRETQDDQAKEALKVINDIDGRARNVFHQMGQSGTNAFKQIGQAGKTFLMDLLYEMTARPFMIKVGMAVTGASAGSLAQAAGGSGINLGSLFGGGGGFNVGSLFGGSPGAGGTWSLSNMLNGIGGLFGGGAAAAGGMAASMGGGLSLAGAAGGSLGGGLGLTGGLGSGLGLTGGGGLGFSAGAAGSAMGGAGGALGGALGAIGTALPYIGIAVALFSMLNKGGETRSGATYDLGNFAHGPSGGQIGGAQDLTKSTIGGINDTLKALGSDLQISAFISALEQSTKGKGFVYAGGTLSDGRTFGESSEAVGRNNRRGNKTSEQALKEYGEELQQATIEALQIADVPGLLGDYLRSLGDVAKLSANEIETAYNRINKALTERKALEARYYELTASAAEKLTRTREAERAAIDESNRALLDKVYAVEDRKRAEVDLLSAYEREGSVLRSTIDWHKAYAQQLREYRNQLMLGDKSPLSQAPMMAEAKQQWQQVLTAAMGGDRNAQQQLTGNADAYLNAALSGARTKSEYDVIFGRVTAGLTLAATSAESQATVGEQQLQVMQQQLEGINLLTSTQVSFAQAWAAYVTAKDKESAAAAVVAAQAASQVPGAGKAPPPSAAADEGPGAWVQESVLGGWVWKGSGPPVGNWMDAASGGGFSDGDGDGIGGFATGGAFTNRMVMRPTAFETPSGARGMLGEIPEAILPLANVGGRLGVRAVGGGGQDSGAVVRQLQALTQVVALQQRALDAIAQRTYESASRLDELVTRGVYALPAPDAADNPLQTQVLP